MGLQGREGSHPERGNEGGRLHLKRLSKLGPACVRLLAGMSIGPGECEEEDRTG